MDERTTLTEDEIRGGVAGGDPRSELAGDDTDATDADTDDTDVDADDADQDADADDPS